MDWTREHGEGKNHVTILEIEEMKTKWWQGMSKNIVEKGNLDGPLLLYNRSSQRAIDFSAKFPAGKTEVVGSLADGVSRADVILSCIANDEAVQETFKAILEENVKGKLFIESSTIHPDTTDALAKDVVAKGAEFVAAPVFGAPQMAEAGQLIGVLAGPAASVARAKPWFKGVTSSKEIDLSDKPYSKALTLKVLGNTFILNMAEQLAEAHVVAEKTGLGTEAIHQIVDSIFGGPYTAYSQRMLTGDYYNRDEPLFAVELARKDARHAMSLAESVGVRLRNVEASDAHLAMAYEHVGSSADMAGIYGAIRKESGLKYENDAQMFASKYERSFGSTDNLSRKHCIYKHSQLFVCVRLVISCRHRFDTIYLRRYIY